jgi:DNA/RNA-binding domain of Phe-tRNA-synthetase-like protein
MIDFALPIAVAPHPRLRIGIFITEFPAALGESPTPDWLGELLCLEAAAPMEVDDSCRQAIRDLLRGFGYRPTGRGKPSSEYLRRAAASGSLAPINLAVDAANAVSLHSGLPISVVDADRLQPPLTIGIGAPGQAYVFNASGQTIELEGLLCLGDAAGPCASPVKDSQRTKAFADTRRTLSVVWGAAGLEERLRETLEWYRRILERAGSRTAAVDFEMARTTRLE